LAKAERGRATVERYRDQPVPVAADRRFIAHPGRADRALCPANHDDVGRRKRLLDRTGELVAA
jgi:hypothetical protein